VHERPPELRFIRNRECLCKRFALAFDVNHFVGSKVPKTVEHGRCCCYATCRVGYFGVREAARWFRGAILCKVGRHCSQCAELVPKP
jgi:hypothetical protein